MTSKNYTIYQEDGRFQAICVYDLKKIFSNLIYFINLKAN